MIATITTALLLAVQTSPQEPQGKGYQNAAGDYGKIAEMTTETAQLERRLKIAEERVETLGAEIEGIEAELKATDTRENLDLVYIRDHYTGEQRDQELAKAQRGFDTKRTRLQAGKASLETDRQRAHRDVVRLRTDMERAKSQAARRAHTSSAAAGPSALETAEQRIRAFAEAKADQLGMATVMPMPTAWIRPSAKLSH